MKRGLKTLLVAFVLLVGIISLTGCNKKNDPTAGFKNPKTIEYKTDKGTIQLTYDDDGGYEVTENDPYVILKNEDDNFRIDIDYSNNTVKQQETSKTNFAKDTTNYTIKDVEFNNYKGYTMVSKKYATSNIYLYLDKNNDIISNIKVSSLKTSDTEKELNNGKKAEDVLYNLKKVQQILKTLKYVK